MVLALVGLLLCSATAEMQMPRVLNAVRPPPASGDVTPPTVTITAPTDQATYDAGTTTPLTTLAGTCSETIASGRWANAATGGSGAISTGVGTTSWTVVSISLITPSNAITVYCTDAAGNESAADTLTVSLSSGAAVTVYLDEDFDACADWTTGYGVGADSAVCGAADGLRPYSSGSTSNAGLTTLESSAACEGGSGKCILHRRGDGWNNTAGGVKWLANPTTLTRLYVCFDMKYQSGVRFRNSAGTLTGQTPIQTKEVYVNAAMPIRPSFTWGFHGSNGGINVVNPGSDNSAAANAGWPTLAPSNVSDGAFDKIEMLWEFASNGDRKSWINDDAAETGTYNWTNGTSNNYIDHINLGNNGGYYDADNTPGTDVSADFIVYFDNLYIASDRPASGQSRGVCGTVP